MQFIRKKIHIFIVLICILFFFTPIAIASSEYSISADTSILKNEELNLEISLEKATNKILGLQGEINYNQDVLELKKIEILKEGWNITALNKETGAFLLEITDELFYNNNAYIGEKDKVLKAIFELKKNENTEIKIKGVKAVNSDFETINLDESIIKVNLANSNLVAIVITIFIILAIILLIVFTKVRRKKNT